MTLFCSPKSLGLLTPTHRFRFLDAFPKPNRQVLRKCWEMNLHLCNGAQTINQKFPNCSPGPLCQIIGSSGHCGYSRY